MSKPRYRALLIGNAVFRRDPQGLPRLHGPRADVDALHDALTDSEYGMFSAENIEVLIDRNLQSLREELHRFFIEDAITDDVLLLYYSGHGKLDLLNRLFLCASDTRVNALRVTALQYKDDIEALIEESPASSKITVLDCCHSGAFRGGELEVGAIGRGTCVLTSSRANELAIDTIGPNGTSPFTNAVVTGLRLAEAQGDLTTQELYEFVARDLSPAGNSRPQFYFDGEGAIALARRPERALTVEPSRAELPVVQQVMEILTPRLEAPEAQQTQSRSAVPYDPVGMELEALGPLPVNAIDPDTKSLRPEVWSLPEPRTRLWQLLNLTVTSTLESDDDSLDKAAVVSEIIEASARLDPKWPKAILKRLGAGEIRQAALEALVSELAIHDSAQAVDIVQEQPPATPDRVSACLALAGALHESEQELAESTMQEVINSLGLLEGSRRAVATAVRVMGIFASAADSDNDASEPGRSDTEIALRRVASAVANLAPQNILARVDNELHRLVSSFADASEREAMVAEAALLLAPFDPQTALHYLSEDGHLLPRSAFEHVPVSGTAKGAAAMLGLQPGTADRLFEFALRRYQPEKDWVELLSTLLSLLKTAPAHASTYADHLIQTLERVVEHVPEEHLWMLSDTAEELAATAPAVAEQLLNLDPDEESIRRELMAAARAAAPVDIDAAKRMAARAERMVSSIVDAEERTRELMYLAEAYAAIDPHHAIRLLRSIPPKDSLLAVALSHVAKVMAAEFPSLIDNLILSIDQHENANALVADIVEGVAAVDPDWAVRLALPLPDSVFKGSALAVAVVGLIERSTSTAEKVARSISHLGYRAQAMASVAKAVAETEPEQAASIARDIPDDDECLQHKADAYLSAALVLLSVQSSIAESYLARAERTARKIADAQIGKCTVFTRIAVAYNGIAPTHASLLLNEAEQLALEVPDEYGDFRTSVLSGIMVAWATVGPGQSERIAMQLPEDWDYRDMRIQEAVEAMSDFDSRRAERMMRLISNEDERLEVHSDLVKSMSAVSPARAERLALELPPGEHRALALLAVAEALHQRQSA